MPKGPSGQKRPADAISRAVQVMRIATGQIAESTPAKTIAVETGSEGGKARAKKLSPAKRQEIAKKAVKARWSAKKKSPAL